MLRFLDELSKVEQPPNGEGNNNSSSCSTFESSSKNLNIQVSNIRTKKPIALSFQKPEEEIIEAASVYKSNSEKTETCPHCQKQVTKGHLLRHNRWKHPNEDEVDDFKDEGDFTCKLCERRSFRYRAHLYKHYSSFHFKEDLKQYIDTDKRSCKLCGTELASINNLVNHVGAKHGKVEEFLDEVHHVPRVREPPNANVNSSSNEVAGPQDEQSDDDSLVIKNVETCSTDDIDLIRSSHHSGLQSRRSKGRSCEDEEPRASKKRPGMFAEDLERKKVKHNEDLPGSIDIDISVDTNSDEDTVIEGSWGGEK